MEYKIIDNYLTLEQHQYLYDVIIGNEYGFPWYISNGVAYSGNDNYDDYYLTHNLFINFTRNSDKFDIVFPLIDKLQPFALRRVKVNFYPQTHKIIKHGWHKDNPISHKGAIYYLNTNNGKTILSGDVEVDSIANRMLLFDPSIEHRSTTCTDHQKGRFNIVFNYM